MIATDFGFFTGIQGDVTMDASGDRESAYMVKHIQGEDGEFKVSSHSLSLYFLSLFLCLLLAFILSFSLSISPSPLSFLSLNVISLIEIDKQKYYVNSMKQLWPFLIGYCQLLWRQQDL